MMREARSMSPIQTPSLLGNTIRLAAVAVVQSKEPIPFKKKLPFIILGILTLIPTVVLLRRTGLSRAWVLLSFLPLGMLIVLWLVAFKSWNETEGVGDA